LDNDNIVASVKVERSLGISILRGMYIASHYQGKGLGTKLIKHIKPILNETTAYCMPFEHLECFYRQIGFKKVNLNRYPEFLKASYLGYEAQGYQIIPMMRKIVN
jgi:GNAT superfamily N-acetyltransferase